MGLSTSSMESAFLRKSNLKFTLINFLLDSIFEKYTVDDLSDSDKFDEIAKDISYTTGRVISEFYQPLINEEDSINYSLIKAVFGFGVIENMIDNSLITEITVKGPDAIYIRKQGKLRSARNAEGHLLCFSSLEELRVVLKRLIATNKVELLDNINQIHTFLPDGIELSAFIESDKISMTLRK